MNTVLMKYQCGSDDYLICDTGRNNLSLNEKMVRMLCGRNFGAAVRGFITGTAGADGCANMKAYNPDGTVAQEDEGAKSAFLRYLSDEGYKCDTEGCSENVCCTGKVFVMDELLSKIVC